MLSDVDAIPTSARTAHGERFYGQMKLSGKLRELKDEPSIDEFGLWRVIENSYPYDMIFKKHHMLLPKRVVAEYSQLTEFELEELEQIVANLRLTNEYDLIFENFPKRRSILGHYHLHLATYHDKRSDFKL